MERQHLQLKTSWDEVKEIMKENDITLTDEDLTYEPGQEEALLERLSQKMNKSKEKVRAYIESIASNSGLAG